MKSRNRDREEINENCEYLESLGFEILHEDSSVKLGDMEFDFSATRLDIQNILRVVMVKAYREGQTEGVLQNQQDMRLIMGIN